MSDRVNDSNRQANLEMLRAIRQYIQLDPKTLKNSEVLLDVIEQAFERNSRHALRVVLEGGPKQ